MIESLNTIRAHKSALEEQELVLLQKLNSECVHNRMPVSDLVLIHFQCQTKSNKKTCYLCKACGLHTHL